MRVESSELRVQNIKTSLKDKVSNWTGRYGRRYYCAVAPERIVEVGQLLFEGHGLRLATISGVDEREHIELLYHFAVDEEGAFISLRVALDKENLEIDSLAPIIKAAEWIEREIHEMLGVDFRGHPDLKHLLLADDWPEGTYPLRRDE